MVRSEVDTVHVELVLMEMQLGMDGVLVNNEGVWHHEVSRHHVGVVEIVAGCMVLLGEVAKSVTVVTIRAHVLTLEPLSMHGSIDTLHLFSELFKLLVHVHLLLVIFLDVGLTMETSFMEPVSIEIVVLLMEGRKNVMDIYRWNVMFLVMVVFVVMVNWLVVLMLMVMSGLKVGMLMLVVRVFVLVSMGFRVGVLVMELRIMVPLLEIERVVVLLIDVSPTMSVFVMRFIVRGIMVHFVVLLVLKRQWPPVDGLLMRRYIPVRFLFLLVLHGFPVGSFIVVHLVIQVLITVPVRIEDELVVGVLMVLIIDGDIIVVMFVEWLVYTMNWLMIAVFMVVFIMYIMVD